MTPKIFVDTDIVIDLLTDRKPFANAAITLFELNERGKIAIYISAVSINNIYYIARRYLGHKKTLSVIEKLMECSAILGTTETEIKHALDNDFKDFEDSIQYSTALAAGSIDAIITRNVKDYRESELAVFTASDYIKSMNVSPW